MNGVIEVTDLEEVWNFTFFGFGLRGGLRGSGFSDKGSSLDLNGASKWLGLDGSALNSGQLLPKNRFPTEMSTTRGLKR